MLHDPNVNINLFMELYIEQAIVLLIDKNIDKEFKEIEDEKMKDFIFDN